MSVRHRRVGVLLLASALVLGGCARSTGARVTLAPEPPRTANASDVKRNEALDALDVFVALLAADDRAFRIDEEATLSTPAGAIHATGRMDIVGEDMLGDLRMSLGDESVRFEFVLVGNGLWAREGDGAWKKVPRRTLAASDALEVLVAGVAPRQLAYRGERTVDGTAMYHFQSRAPIAYVSSTAESPGSINRIDVYLAKDGTPLIVEVEYSGIYQLIPSVKGRMTSNATMTFSRVGKPVKIEPPA